MIKPKRKPTVSEVASHYDELDRFYREIWGDHLHHGLWTTGRESQTQAVLQMTELVAREAEIKPGDAVCDIGCGYGATSRVLARSYGSKVTGLTVSKAQYDYAKQQCKNRRNPRFLLRDWLKNRLLKGSFDAALAIESSEHMPNQWTFFSEAHRVLRPGGRFVVCAWLSRDHPSESEERFLLEPICREGRLFAMGSETEYRRLLKAAGFESIRFADFSARVKKTWPTCIRKAAWHAVKDPEFRRFLWKKNSANKIFAKTLFRMWAAYEVGSLRYGVFTATKGGLGQARKPLKKAKAI
jgi:Cyclopropane fatty acid synthase and related methyltransferases